MTEVLALIPARGGSKSLPRKNVLTLGGIPLVAHSIRAALGAQRVTRVAVSTEDAEIAEIARRFGAEVIDRPVSLAGDESSSESALLQALEYLEASENYRPDILCFLQCTSPFTSSEDIDSVIDELAAENADSALAVTRFHYFLWRSDESGAAGINHHQSVRLRRQDREPEYLETGAVYAMRTDGFRAAKHRFFGKTVLSEMPASRVFEIDDPEDFTLAAERMRLAANKVDQELPSPVQGVVFDFDGVFTDDRVLVDEQGREAVNCSRRDGMGIEMLRRAGMPMLVISKERNPVVARRCEKLGLEFHQGSDNKIDLLDAWMNQRSLDPQKLIYVGNDVNDLECMAAVGCAVVPADAHPAAQASASIILRADGGKGAVRELADMILETLRDS